MKLESLSPKQRDFLLNSTARYNIAYGSIRSGKTVVSLIRWLHLIATAPPSDDINFLMIGKTERTLRRNVLDLIINMVGPEDFRFNAALGECRIFGRRVYIAGANDERAAEKIRGLTLYAAYCDELTLFPEDVFNVLVGRLSTEGAMLIATTNPHSPYHYIKKQYLDRQDKLNLKSWHFVLEDNTTLPKEFIDDIKSTYIPGSVWYKRDILGEWATAEGAIFPFFTDDPADGFVITELPDDFTRYVVAMDYGQQHPTVMGLAGFSPAMKRWIVIKEFYTKNKTNATFSREFGNEILNYKGDSLIAPEYTEVDPGGGGLSLILQLRNDYPYLNIKHAIKTDVMAEVQSLATALFNHRISIYKQGCPQGIQELANYVYDEKAKKRGVDEPLKHNDDFPDMLRYLNNRISRI